MRRKRILYSVCPLALLAALYGWKVVGGDSEDSDQGVTPPPPLSIGDVPPQDSDLSPGQLATKKPVEFLAHCLAKYRQADVSGYTCTFCMHECVKGQMKTPDEIECFFKESPFSVLMHWKKGAGRAAASLYVSGENENKMCIRPSGTFEKLVGFVKRPVDGSDARDSARYLITEFGLRCGTERTYKAWKALQDRGMTLQVEYLGVQYMEEAGGRPCHVVHRHCDPPEEEGLTDITIYVDVDTWFQVGSVLKRNGELIGEYWFKDIKLDPEFDPSLFKPETLKKY